MRQVQRWIGTGVVLAAVLLWAAGCQKQRGVTTEEGHGGGHGHGEHHDHDHKGGAEHDHPEAGPHGGALGEAGDEKYHTEFLVNHEKKQTTVYVLDGTAKKAMPIAADTLTLTLTNVEPKATVLLKADPEPGDPKGKSSRFVGTSEPLGKEMEFKGEITGKVGDTPYTWKFEEKDEHHDHKHEKKK